MVPMPKSTGFSAFVRELSAAHGISETTAGRIVEKVALDVHGIDKPAVRSKVAPEVRATIENYFRCRNELLECFGLPGKEHEFVMAYMQGEIAPKEWHPVRSLPAEHASKWNQAVASMFPSLSVPDILDAVTKTAIVLPRDKVRYFAKSSVPTLIHKDGIAAIEAKLRKKRTVPENS